MNDAAIFRSEDGSSSLSSSFRDPQHVPVAIIAIRSQCFLSWSSKTVLSVALRAGMIVAAYTRRHKTSSRRLPY